MTRFYTHSLPLAQPSVEPSVSLSTAFRLVAGVSGSGREVLPVEASNYEYIVAGGLVCLDCVTDLGRPGGTLAVVFPQPVLAVIVATLHAQRPEYALVSGEPAKLPATCTSAVLGKRTDLKQPLISVLFQWENGDGTEPAELFFSDRKAFDSIAPLLEGRTVDEVLAFGFFK